ncbi:hypothetical protein ROZALSC1DRAFT_24488 [Rozella allomycis CSF55]|uniref:Uncharacterized protein n=1 Tax=Rozella allomycis (strain CSF55) TaxID=988480 RepID=A0A4P9YDE0_ROZAC|nr:hypothetical protein ROZALSC1DRAFT_24488 [Rozella allomycis CSF55]
MVTTRSSDYSLKKATSAILEVLGRTIKRGECHGRSCTILVRLVFQDPVSGEWSGYSTLLIPWNIAYISNIIVVWCTNRAYYVQKALGKEILLRLIQSDQCCNLSTLENVCLRFLFMGWKFQAAYNHDFLKLRSQNLIGQFWRAFWHQGITNYTLGLLNIIRIIAYFPALHRVALIHYVFRFLSMPFGSLMRPSLLYLYKHSRRFCLYVNITLLAPCSRTMSLWHHLDFQNNGVGQYRPVNVSQISCDSFITEPKFIWIDVKTTVASQKFVTGF